MGKQSLIGFAATDLVDDPMTMIGVHGGFYGVSLPAEQIEAMVAGHVPRTHIKEIPEIYGEKWWDYRRLSPGHSFYLFAHHYYNESRTAARKFVNEKPNIKGHRAKGDTRDIFAFVGPALVQMEVSDIWERDQAHVTGMWNAMLVADALGIPYDQYTRLACRIAIDNLWKRIPRPSQLYSEKLAAMVWESWESLRTERLFLAKHPIYSEENYLSLSIQDEYREFVIERLKDLKSGLVPALMQAVYLERQLPEGMAARHFPANSLTRARLLAA